MTDSLGGFGTELSKNLADKWLSLLASPGALYLAVFAVERALGQSHALDVSRLVRHITSCARDPAVTTASGQIVLLPAVLAASVAIGLAARGLGSAIERTVLAADCMLANSRSASGSIMPGHCPPTSVTNSVSCSAPRLR